MNKEDKERKFEKLSRDNPDSTKIMAGHTTFTVEQLEDEMVDDKSDIGKKLRSIEHILDQY